MNCSSKKYVMVDYSLSLYTLAVIRHKVCLPLSDITDFKCIQQQLTQYVSSQISGKCIPEGFVKPNSCTLRSHTVGTFSAGNIVFIMEIECLLCCPKQGDVINCVAKTVTQAGIRAHACTDPSPVVIYISREMQDSSQTPRMMDAVKLGDRLTVRVIGHRFELNDKHVSIIGEWI